jgi:hypothetical protein
MARLVKAFEGNLLLLDDAELRDVKNAIVIAAYERRERALRATKTTTHALNVRHAERLDALARALAEAK